uniref:Uncharacterized protein n=1 Tax=Arundo donax TaxID=35708 RepID=A0A0A9H160_ARUDO
MEAQRASSLEKVCCVGGVAAARSMRG